MEFIKTMFGILIFCLAIGAIVSTFIFAYDVIKWHDKEEKVKIVPSNSPEPDKDYTESEVSNIADDAGKYNSSAFFDLGSES